MNQLQSDPRNFQFNVISGETISRILNDDLDGCIDVVRQAYLAHSDGLTVNPPSIFLRFEDKPTARIIGLPAHVQRPSALSGIKWIASYPDNARQGFPRASAVLILNDHETGYPFACMEGSIISAARTAASAVLAAQELSSTDRHADRLLVVGNGLIARYIYRFLMGTGWKIKNVVLYDLDPSTSQRFAEAICDGRRHDSVTIAPDLPSAMMDSDLILFTTVAGKPHVHDRSLLRHNPLVLHVSLRDLAPELLLDACNIVDDVDHVMHADTSPHLAEKLTGNRDFVAGTISDVVRGRVGRDPERPTIFSPFGLGVLDIAVGKWVFDRAIQDQAQIAIQGFFHDLER
ncbi:2,3-diaminopropionate biosynthesis protein SbnB [Bradyrhizobium sp. 188]|uniref:2,3-diaminopropionate biosynthesis protein SbnB n=1 Tax=Bradyrhizobium sp. 188 TaxID=2782656 RepID=UPI001FF92338|nr:2,3-diaminopropionate biosynthesis protein SbnB [Bradyrhizobium sp. 188]MCK1502131.1 2,3-diaminopropionate biosynthesis protein SbnB [Bradyrhizobium sp. 188]